MNHRTKLLSKMNCMSMVLVFMTMISCKIIGIQVLAWTPSSSTTHSPRTTTKLAASTRRQMIEELSDKAAGLAGITLALSTIDANKAWAADPTPPFQDLLRQVNQAKAQLQDVPSLIEQEKWDAVRAILIAPPLADCWAKTNRPLLSNYAQALGDAGGDELAALEAKEELVSHLRYLDMAVYNNVFNPITVEGKSGATKELVRSYYEDPINEYKASSKALEELVNLATETK